MLAPWPRSVRLKRTLRSSAPVHTPVTRSGVMPMNQPSLLFCVVPVLQAVGALMLPYLARLPQPMRRRIAVPWSATAFSMSSMMYEVRGSSASSVTGVAS